MRGTELRAGPLDEFLPRRDPRRVPCRDSRCDWSLRCMTDTARVILWGSDIGAVTWLEDRGIGVFQYTPEFASSGIEFAPLMMLLTDAWLAAR